MSRDRSLPIFELESDLLKAVQKDDARIVIEAPTGSGKSTQIPQMLADSPVGDAGQIYVLQPRRLAARMLARRVAQERNGRCGEEIGYQVRFENVVSRNTKIRYVTEGILIRLLIEKPDLAGVSAVVLDEFHERHFYGDISLARCLEVQQTLRPDLKIVAMSATLETEALKAYLGDGCVHLRSEGRTFPVDILYEPQRERHKGEIWDQAARVMRDHFKRHGVEGHTLVFMPGRHEIRKTVEALSKASWTGGFEIHELYGELPPEKQDAAVASGGPPRIVVATNVAETSITIDGVRLVVDSGMERRSAFDSRRGLTTLHIEKISRASADQRAGRAGRTADGTAIRLWSERDHEQRATATPAEIQRMDLAEAVLILKASGVDDVRKFPWFEKPDPAALERSIRWLKQLGALHHDDEQLTETGQKISRLPLPPRYGRVLLEAGQLGHLEFFAVVAGLTQSRPLFSNRKQHSSHLERSDFAEPGDSSDFFALFRAWDQMRANRFDFQIGKRMGIHVAACRDVDRVAQQFIRITQRACPDIDQSAIPDDETLARILLTGFSDRIAKKLSASTLACAVVDSRRGQLDKDSVVARGDQIFIAGEMIEIEGRDLQVKLNLCTRVEEEWIRERYPDDFVETAGAAWDDRSRKVEARKEKRFRDLVLESKPSGEIPLEEAASLLAEKVLSGELNLKAWDQSVAQHFARINLISEAFPEYEIPKVDEDSKRLLLEQICAGATSYKQIKDRKVWPIIKEWLPYHQAILLDQLAPERIEIKLGKSVKVIYEEGEKPKLSALIQHLFGIEKTPTIGQGRIPLVVEILAPNHRPVQVTEDLAGFWKGSYAGVRTQLRGRYPKHEWPEY